MLVPHSVSSSDAHAHDDHKFSTGHLYLRQQHTVQIIQLVEGPPPPPRKISSVSYSSSSSDSDDESAGSSYCSSDLPPEQSEEQSTTLRSELPSETYSTTKRILAWRENFSSHLSATASEPSLSSALKRKINLEDCDDVMSRSSKRSRSQASQAGASVVSLGMHSCPACDASFMTRQSLRQHGRDAKANEACSVAVEYAFE
ncbi:hypothetical protein D9615_003817 [Tricholomella constricta]|uniref:Uncharacterized protein n=1 Tax=Tricholomella constricta TaxID=117010 RepID=A0A8H5HI91_9AGAR|nr:hypothetical protein D9615_003817 [Tricholomella constricta]